MLSRTLRRSVLDTRIPLPPPFLLPRLARSFNSTPQHIETPPTPPLESSPPLPKHTAQRLARIPSPPPPPSKPLVLSDSIKELLPLLAAQPAHYITALIHGKPYLLTTGDTVRLPFHMPGVVPGDVLRLNRATVLGSRDYTLKGSEGNGGNWVDERLFEARVRVIGTEAEPMRKKEKTKRRNRKVKTVKSKMKFTVLRVMDVRVKGLEELGLGM